VTNDLKWWQSGVIYQLLVPSFLDRNGDGLGDLSGVMERLDYLEWLGVRAVWLSPFYPSPLVDLGYDATDFTDVHPAFGSLDSFDELVESAHRRGIGVILDWIPNHTSSEHPWFVESASSRDSDKRDWYIWRDPAPDGSPPNNWISIFGGSVWEWHEATGQYYLHTFHPTQPDLNWRNGAVEDALLATLRFWLDRGVDGFRLDACCLMFKDEEFRDNPPNPDFREGIDGPDSRLCAEYTRDQEGLHEALARIRDVVEGYEGERVLLGELYLPLDQVVRFYGGTRRELHLPLHMNLTWTEWNAESLAAAILEYQSIVSEAGWPATSLSTHDAPRLADRVGDAQARVAAMLLLTSRGTPILYYGEEIGMRGVELPIERARDPQGRRTGRNRDPARTPMQWNGHEPNAGFSSAEPWLPVADDFTERNVLASSADAGSLLTLYRRLIELRRVSPALIDGRYEAVEDCAAPLFAYRRIGSEQTLLVALNFNGEPRDVSLPGPGGHVRLSTYLDRENETCRGRIPLRGDEGLVIVLD
jgi:alpha-glucosidase